MTFAARLKGVLVLDARTFEEIEADTSATAQALLVVVVASVAAGLGAGVRLGLTGLLRETLGALVGWVMWAAVSWFIGAKLLPEPQTRTNMGELLRVIGFAYAPNLFGFFAFIPVARAASSAPSWRSGSSRPPSSLFDRRWTMSARCGRQQSSVSAG